MKVFEESGKPEYPGKKQKNKRNKKQNKKKNQRRAETQ